MKTSDYIRFFTARGLNPIAKADTTLLMLSGKMIRCVDKDTLISAVGSDNSKEEQINAVVDSVHWHLQTKGLNGNLLIMLGKREDADAMAEVVNAVAIMLHNLKKPISVKIAVDDRVQELKKAAYANDRRWMEMINCRDNEIPPKMARDLAALVDDDAFRWYRTVTANTWSGRIDGLQVCVILPDGKTGVLDVGKPGKNGKIGYPRQIFLSIANGKEGFFDKGRIDEVAAIIKKLAESRTNGDLRTCQREHLLEALVLRKIISIVSKKGVLSPVCETYPFQFPALWSSNGQARFIDVLMHIKGIPYVVELKEPNGTSQGQGYRHAIAISAIN